MNLGIRLLDNLASLITEHKLTKRNKPIFVTDSPTVLTEIWVRI